MKNKFKKIVVSVDLSPISKEVTATAKKLAQMTGARLVFQFVVEPDLIQLKRFTGLSDIELMKAELIRLKKTAGLLHPKHKLRVSLGHPSVEIRKLATLEKADTIMLGTQGKAILDRLFLGSVSDSVVREALQSVWIVKGQHKKIRKIFVPIDGSPGSLEALETAMDLARSIKAKIQPVSIVEFEPIPSPSYVDPEDYHRKCLERRKIDIKLWIKKKAANASVLPAIVELGHAASDLPRLVGKTKSDLVLMSTHSRKGFGFTLLGRVAAHMIHRSPCSILLIRPRGWKYKGV